MAHTGTPSARRPAPASKLLRHAPAGRWRDSEHADPRPVREGYQQLQLRARGKQPACREQHESSHNHNTPNQRLQDGAREVVAQEQESSRPSLTTGMRSVPGTHGELIQVSDADLDAARSTEDVAHIASQTAACEAQLQRLRELTSRLDSCQKISPNTHGRL